jgi:hypothetical protein
VIYGSIKGSLRSTRAPGHERIDRRTTGSAGAELLLYRDVSPRSGVFRRRRGHGGSDAEVFLQYTKLDRDLAGCENRNGDLSNADKVI